MSAAETTSAASLLRRLAAERGRCRAEGASPNDGVRNGDLYDATVIAFGGAVGAPLHGVAVVDSQSADRRRIEQLERELKAATERVAALSAANNDLNARLKRAHEIAVELRGGANPVSGGQNACVRPECAVVRERLRDGEAERGELRRQIVRLQLKRG